jgi:sulfur carrier protein
MKLTVNGKEHQAQPGQTVRQLIEDLGLGKAAVAVELNRQVIPRRQHETTTLNEGDVLELVTLVGGG